MRYAVILLVPLVLLYSCRRPDTSGNTAQTVVPDSAAALLEVLNREIASDSQHAFLFDRRARVYLERKQINNALSDISIALELDPVNPAYFITLSDIYLEMGSTDKANDALNKASDLAPMDPVPWFRKGYLYLLLKEYEQSRHYFKQAIHLQPVYPEAYFHLGITCLETGDSALAAQYMQTAVQQNDRYLEAYVMLGSLYAPSSPEVAAAFYRNALRIDSINTQVIYNLGMVLQDLGRDVEAEQHYLHILSMDSSYFLASYNLGYIHLVIRENYTEAIRYFDLTLRLNPAYVDAWYNRGLCYEILGQYDKARNDYQQALRVMPNYPRAVEGMNRLD